MRVPMLFPSFWNPSGEVRIYHDLYMDTSIAGRPIVASVEAEHWSIDARISPVLYVGTLTVNMPIYKTG